MISANFHAYKEALKRYFSMQRPGVKVDFIFTSTRANVIHREKKFTHKLAFWLWCRSSVFMGVYESHGYLWVSMDVYGFLGAWAFMSAYGCLWVSMGIYECLWVSWVSMSAYGFLDGYEYLWVYIDVYGLLGVYGYLWVSCVSISVYVFLGIYGYLWVFTGVHGYYI